MASRPVWKGDKLVKMEGGSLGKEILVELEVWRRSTVRLVGMMERWKLEVQRSMKVMMEENGKKRSKRHEIAVK